MARSDAVDLTLLIGLWMPFDFEIVTSGNIWQNFL
jgi:hypothetical protein